MADEKGMVYKTITETEGNRYRFYCALSGALVCTTEPIQAESAEEELLIAWERFGKKYFNLCHKCGRWVIDAVYNADVWECVECAPYEEEPKYCKNCGVRVENPSGSCPDCGHKLIYEGKE